MVKLDNIDKYINAYNTHGYVVIRPENQLALVNTLYDICKKVLAKRGVVTDKIEDAHITHAAGVNRYFPRAHFNNLVPQQIEKLLAEEPLYELLRQLTGRVTKNPEYSIVSWLPEEIQPGFTGYHQDGPAAEIQTGYPHVWVPITECRDRNMKIIPGSHVYGNFPHGMLGQFVKVKQSHVDLLSHNEQYLQINVGDVLIFSTRALHCLMHNNSNQICWSLEFVCPM